MKYIKFIFAYFYSEEKRSSKQQLGKDFGCFPPRPLNVKKLDHDFFVARVHGLGRIYPIILLAKKLAQSKDTNGVPDKLHECWNQISFAKAETRRAFNELSNSTKTISGKIIFIIAAAIAAPILVPIFIVKVLINIFKIYNKRIDSDGYFIPFFADENRVMIKKGVGKDEFSEAVVAHEHIHMLQHRNGESSCKESRCAEILLSDDWRDDKFLLYTLERNELEARLHEIVLSYYRKNNILPVSPQGFVELLAGSSQFGSLVTETMKLTLSIEEQDPDQRYEERSKVIAEQVKIILLVIKDDDLRRRFIVEVLTTMYGKLLKYYGDDESSRSFLNNISRPNLYDLLYSPKIPHMAD